MQELRSSNCQVGLILSKAEHVALMTVQKKFTEHWGEGRVFQQFNSKYNKIKTFWNMTPCKLETLTFRRSLLSLSASSIITCQNNLKSRGTLHLEKRRNEF
jgi:hypothetical protein